MSAQTPFDQLDLLLSDFNRVEERFFLPSIQEFAEKHPDLTIKTFTLLLKNKDLNIQLKYLILRAIGELKYEALVPILKATLKQEEKIRIMAETVNTLVAINSLPAYKVIADFQSKNKNADHQEKLEHGLKILFNNNPLVYHFDVFYRDRGGVSNLEKSSEILIRRLPEEYIKDLLPSLVSRYLRIRQEALKVFERRPNASYYPTIYNFFKANAHTTNEELFLVMSRALVANAALSIARAKIFQKLNAHLFELKGDRQHVFCIALLKLNSCQLINHAAGIYPQLDAERKLLLLENLNPSHYNCYKDFLRAWVTREDNPPALTKIVEILVHASDLQYLFAALDKASGLRKEKLLNMILDQEPNDIHQYLEKFVNPAENSQMLYLSLQYLLRHSADRYINLIQQVFFSGASEKAKILILRNVNKFEPHSQQRFMEAILKNLIVIRGIKKDFLFSLLGAMNKKVFERDLEEKILNRVLIMLEEASIDEIINFIYFFDKYDINTLEDSHLIIAEFRLIQNTLLKTSNSEDLVPMIHKLIKNIERKLTLKKTVKKKH